ncbi:hypothetical protein ElyMa_005369700 [Elysia marginata]|uniref:RING-type domain-containing protein n=1 Tax=Elysia marginata TaxID=1093978 RepID=A0AAV4ECW3_9GAST|nr:hypothetical protein ElyMa_005369700 [Elysia marginata]
MSQEISRYVMNNCKCVKCKGPLIDPVQLGACLHILCKDCSKEVEAAFFNNINCPMCGMENAKPSILNRISGIEIPLRKDGSSLLCDYEPNHDMAMWNCFVCTKNLCSQCRANHPLDHADCLSLLAPPCNIHLEEENLDAAANIHRDHTDGSLCSALGNQESTWQECPMCKSTSCPHIDVLELLHSPPDAKKARCEISSHIGCDEQPLEKNYFCLKCWIPVCGDCSNKGEHKKCKTKDMENMKPYLELILSDLKQRVSILQAKTKSDLADQQEVEHSLRHHVEVVSKAMDRHKCKDVMRMYSKELEQTNVFCNYLSAFSDALDIEVDENLNTPQYVSLFDRLRQAEGVIDEIVTEVKKRPRPQEHRLVLCELDMFRPCQTSVAPIARECRQPPLAFSFKLNEDIFLVHSIVVKGSDQCFLSCSMTRERKYDAILHYQGENSDPVEKVIDIQPGRYYITRMESGEIVASYSSEHLNAMQYFESDHLMLDQGGWAEFRNTKQLQFKPRGIAATKQNTVLLCVDVPQDKKGHLMKPHPGLCRGTSFLMLMSLQGKVLAEVQHVSNDEMSPK